MASISKEFEKNTITCMAPTKTFNIAGLQSSYVVPVSYTHLRAHETVRNIVCRLLLEKKIRGYIFM
ncbi:hypothetical protein CDFC105_43915 [Clostridioides difficile]|nr:hypothetical protein CDFC105_43915 [Clostridioides difficile]